jgi:ribose transport system substrate-binding protein
MVKVLGGKGKVAIVAAIPGIKTHEDRTQGFKDAISTYPDIEVVARDFSNGDQAKATAITEAMLLANPDIKGIFAQDTPTGHGVAIGVQNSGLDVKVVSYDAQPAQIEDLKSGIIQVLISQPPYGQGFMAVDTAYHYLKGYITKFPGDFLTGFKVISMDNVSDPEVMNNWIYSNKGPKEQE